MLPTYSNGARCLSRLTRYHAGIIIEMFEGCVCSAADLHLLRITEGFGLGKNR